MLVENRLPLSSTVHREKSIFTWQHLDKKEPLSYFLNNLGPYIGWSGAIYDFPAFEDSHNRYVEACVEHSCDFFLSSPAYVGWKNRKTPGPSLLTLTGSGGFSPILQSGLAICNLTIFEKSSGLRQVYTLVYYAMSMSFGWLALTLKKWPSRSRSSQVQSKRYWNCILALHEFCKCGPNYAVLHCAACLPSTVSS